MQDDNRNEANAAGGDISRRDFLATSITAATLSAAGLADAADAPAAPRAAPGQRVLLKGGVVLTMDPKLGDLEKGDVLIDGTKIIEVGANIEAPTAQRIDCTNRIVMPGFVDTHRHIWQGQLRNILPNGRLNPDYTRDITGNARNIYRPEDVYIGDMLSAWGAINAGVTTLLDWSHVSNSPEHSDAAIQGLRETGIRAVYGFGFGGPGPNNRYPGDIGRLRKTHFSSADQLLTLAIATAYDPKHWAAAREVGAPVSLHHNGTGQLEKLAKEMKSDCVYIHCPNMNEQEWKLVRDTGGHVSIAAPIEMEMGHGIPPIQQCIDLKIPWSLSNDVETEIPAEFFTQMRTVFTLQRMQIFTRERAGEKNVPAPITVKEVVEVATIGGARGNWLDKKIGSLTPGKEADILLLATDLINVMPLNHAYGAVVLAMDTSNVDTVFIRGRVRKWKGRLVGLDMAKLTKQVEASRLYVLSRAGWPNTVLGGYAPGH